MKKLLIVTSTFPKHADDAVTARFVFDLARALVSHFQVYVLAPHSAGAEDTEEIEGVHVFRFKYFLPQSLQYLTSGRGMLADIRSNPLAFFQIPFFLVAEFFNILKVVRREKIDIINSHWVVPQGLVCALIKKITGVYHVSTAHAADIFLLKRFGFLGRIIARFVASRVDLFLPVSSYLKTHLEELSGPLPNYAIIPMGVDTNKFRLNFDQQSARKKLNLDNAFTFLFVGKFVEKKGIHFLIQAVGGLKEKDLDFRLLLVGGGPLEKKIKTMVTRAQLTREVKFLGWIKNNLLPGIYSASDVLVVPSVFDRKGESEGMPVVILEAMAMAMPVLASRISGIPDIVKDGYNGWLVEPANAEALAQKVEEIFVSDLKPYKNEALKTASSCSYQHVALKYKEAIEKLAQ